MQRESLNFLLQKADFDVLKSLYKKIKESHKITILQAPTQQTLLQPIYDPISQGEFYAGEILVTTTIVGIDKALHRGWAMVLDNHEKLSLYIAVCDGAFGAGFFKKEIEDLAHFAKQEIKKVQMLENQKVNATKVSFDLMMQG